MQLTIKKEEPILKNYKIYARKIIFTGDFIYKGIKANCAF